ncbi:MAG: transglutaminase family protein, partial [Verrucomicrobiota bacterium]
EKTDPELHAWTELFIPGGGWRGFDPSTGLAVSDHHITLACSSNHPETATVSGSYRGSAQQEFNHSLSITVN